MWEVRSGKWVVDFNTLLFLNFTGLMVPGIWFEGEKGNDISMLSDLLLSSGYKIVKKFVFIECS